MDVPPEFPDPIQLDDDDLTEFEAQLQAVLDEQHGSLEGKDTDDQVKQIRTCVGEMQDVTNKINILLKRETDVRNTLVNLEELLYNYRIMDSYFKKRIETLDSILGIFDPLIRKKRDIEYRLSILRRMNNIR